MRWTWTPDGSPDHGQPEDPDRGSAVIEFIGLGLLLLIPIIYLVITVSRVQAGSFAVVAAAEQAGQAISVAQAEDLDRAPRRRTTLLRFAAALRLDHRGLRLG